MALRLAASTVVEVFGLLSEEGQKLNGHVGTVVGYDEAAGRYAIAFDAVLLGAAAAARGEEPPGPPPLGQKKTTKRVKGANLRAVEDVAPPAEPELPAQDEVECPVCMDVLVDPVTLQCGHNQPPWVVESFNKCTDATYRLNIFCMELWRITNEIY